MASGPAYHCFKLHEALRLCRNEGMCVQGRGWPKLLQACSSLIEDDRTD
jgi:hypothetical protein